MVIVIKKAAVYWVHFMCLLSLLTLFFVFTPQKDYQTAASAPQALTIFINNSIVVGTILALGHFSPRLGKLIYWFNLIRFLLVYVVALSLYGIGPVLARLALFAPVEILAMTMSLAITQERGDSLNGPKWHLMAATFILVALAAIIERWVLLQ